MACYVHLAYHVSFAGSSRSNSSSGQRGGRDNEAQRPLFTYEVEAPLISN